MLLRAYRVTDRLSLVVLKSGAGITSITLDGASILVGTMRRGGGGFLGAIIGAVVGIAGILWAIISAVGMRLRQVLSFFLGGVGTVAVGAGRVGARAAGQTTRGARSGPGDAMARRAAQSEIDVALTEDPLKRQNRVLSGLIVVALAALVAVVFWATGSGDNNEPIRTGSGSGSSLTVDLGTPQTDSDNTDSGVAGPVLPTPVPTATALPEVLEVRGSLAFVAREQGQDDIWVVPVGGAQPIRLINSAEDDRDPAWSPDGQRLAFASRRNGNWDIFYYDMQTGETTQLTFGLSFQGRPVWSSDGALVAYESYQAGNLDIMVTSLDGSMEPQRLPSWTDGAEFSPAWAPDPGRRIAYTTWVDGNQEIFVYDLDADAAVNVTNTPDINEDYAAWSPDGRMLAYSAVDAGIEKVFIRSYEDLNAPAQVFRRGRMPFWSPDGTALVFAVDTPQSTQFVVEALGGSGVATSLTAINLPAGRPVWTEAPLPAALVNAGSAELNADPLYVEQVEGTGGDPPYRLGTITNMTNPDLLANLNERVNDSFNALRQRVLEEAGWDFFGELEAALWDLNRRPQPGEPNRNWHRTGRAFSFNRDFLLAGFPRPVEIVREDTDLETYWRVYVRVDEDAQSGQLGEPLRDMPWEFVDAASGDVEAYDRGGRLKTSIPSGYYVDVTQLALDYGWLSVPAGDNWRSNVNTINYWMFYKPQGLSWYDAMRELYTVGELGGFNPTPTPQPIVPTNESEDG